MMEDGQKFPLHVVSYKISGGRLLLQVYKFAKMSVCMNNQQTTSPVWNMKEEATYCFDNTFLT